MPGTTGIYRFHHFELDVAARRLRRGRKSFKVPKRQVDVLARLLSRPGETVSKDALGQAAWGGDAVSYNRVEKLVSSLRRMLGRRRDGSHHIETVHGDGYRFDGPVHCRDVRPSDEELDARLAPHRAFADGRPCSNGCTSMPHSTPSR